ncbi:MAG TPA: NAD(P)H-dependent oxidoreductase [Flavobacteriaceae bacterium]|nr:NAD(P)H-dependent oxidoreductase [Flavobacteriaceae bacterium]
MNIIEQLSWRYATKRFNPSAYISQEKIEILKAAFNLTATSFGLQPIKLVVVKDKALQQQLLGPTMNQRQVVDASHVLIFCVETQIDSAYIETYFNRVHDLRNTSKTILKPFQEALVSDFSKKTKEEIKDWATKQAYLAMGNLLTVCAMERIDSCPMEGFDPIAYNTVLNLKDRGLESVLVMPIGYRAEDDMFADFKKVRKTVAESTLEL